MQVGIWEEGPPDPTLHDPRWGAFFDDFTNTGVSPRTDWERYRAALRRIAKRHQGHVPLLQMRRAIAWQAFLCATHWLHSPRRVRHALRIVLTFPIGPEKYTYAAAEFWLWAFRTSSEDLPMAEEMLTNARKAMMSLDESTRRNLTAMLASLPRRAQLSIDDA